MKTNIILKLTCAVLFMFAAVSCGKEDENPILTTDAPSEIVFTSGGTSPNAVITISTNQPSWEHTLSPADGNGWLTASASGNELRLTALPNTLTSAPSVVTLVIRAGKAEAEILSVSQQAAGTAFSIEPALTEITFSADGMITLPGQEPANSALFKVSTNVPAWDVSLDPVIGLGQDWLTFVTNTAEGTFTLVALPNPAFTSPTAVAVRVTAGGDQATINASQEPRPTGPWDGRTLTETVRDNEGIFRLYDATQLAWLANEVFEGRHFLDEEFVQMNDIDLNDKPWLSIGSYFDGLRPFKGTYDGNGYKISRLHVDHSDGRDSGGLFGTIQKATLKNINVSQANVTGASYCGGVCGENYGGTISNCTFDGTVSGRQRMGAICGYNNDGGLIENCTNNGTVNAYDLWNGGVCGGNDDGIITRCVNNGTVSGVGERREYIGGITGYNPSGSSVMNCINNGTVTGTERVGGVCGWGNGGDFLNCINTGAVSGVKSVGGISGSHWKEPLNGCINTGEISGIGDESQQIGGITGQCDGNATVVASYNTGKISGGSNVGGVSGLLIRATVSACYNTGLVTGNTNVGGVFGLTTPESSIWSNNYWLKHTTGATTGVGGSDDGGATPFGAVSWPSATLSGWGIGSGDGSYWKSLGAWTSGGNPDGINSVFPVLWWEE